MVSGNKIDVVDEGGGDDVRVDRQHSRLIVRAASPMSGLFSLHRFTGEGCTAFLFLVLAW